MMNYVKSDDAGSSSIGSSSLLVKVYKEVFALFLMDKSKVKLTDHKT